MYVHVYVRLCVYLCVYVYVYVCVYVHVYVHVYVCVYVYATALVDSLTHRIQTCRCRLITRTLTSPYPTGVARITGNFSS